jgi:hypothetical protein
VAKKTRIWLSDSGGTLEQEIASELGIDLHDLRQLLRVRDEMRSLALPEVDCLINIVSDVILHCTDPQLRRALLADLLAQMTDWTEDESPEIVH